MAAEVETDKYFFKKEQVTYDSDEEFQYEEVPVDDVITPDIEEDLETAVKTLHEVSLDAEAAAPRESLPRATVTQRPEVVDDFVRNFLVRMRMFRSLDCFQTEWYEKLQKGELRQKDVGTVPDVYQRNQHLDQELQFLRAELDKYKEAALKARETYVKMRKERDYHRMHHKRVVQEKNKLITDVKRLKEHYAQYEPTLRELQTKYESAMKEKMLTRLERDRAVGQLNRDNPPKSGTVQRGGATIAVDAAGRGPTQRALARERDAWEGRDVALETEPRHPNDSEFPPDKGVNPYLAQKRAPPAHVTRAGGFKLSTTIQAHTHAVSGVALHPRKQVVATTSDDATWRLWSVPGGEVIMTGEGHADWVSDCDFHPSGGKLVTSSGDATVKIWDFKRSECVHTFTEHNKPVWGCTWHSCGHFVASASMDNTGKVWDLNSLRCRFTLRGHADSVNSIEFLPFSNTLLTSSADKTLVLWDARTGLAAHTFYGHMHSVNHCTFNLKGDTLASCDSYGVVKLWDVRNVAEVDSVDCGPHPANKVAFDSTAAVLAIASNDASVHMYELASGQVSELMGHEDAVQCAVWDRAGQFLLTGSSDLTLRIWS